MLKSPSISKASAGLLELEGRLAGPWVAGIARLLAAGGKRRAPDQRGVEAGDVYRRCGKTTSGGYASRGAVLGGRRVHDQSDCRRDQRRRKTMRNSFKNVNDGNFTEAVLNAKKPVLVDFWAQWCGPCRALAPIVDELAQQYAGTAQFMKLNVDDNPQLVERYRVQAIPTLILVSRRRRKTAHGRCSAQGTDHTGHRCSCWRRPIRRKRSWNQSWQIQGTRKMQAPPGARKRSPRFFNRTRCCRPNTLTPCGEKPCLSRKNGFCWRS